MKKLFVLLFTLLLVVSCSTNPEPIVFGTDLCHFCRMTLMDNKFGGELVTEKGKVYKFDDLSCLLDYYNSGSESKDSYKHKLVIDFANPGKLIDATTAFYVTSPEIRSPMNGQTAAFESKSAMYDFNKQLNGNQLSWGGLGAQSK